MKDSGKQIWPTVKANSSTLMEINMTAIGIKTKPMDMEYMFIEMEIDMKGNGQVIFKMDLEQNIGLMAPYIKDIFIMD